MNKKKIGLIVAVTLLIIGYLYFRKYDDNPYHEFRNISNVTAGHMRSEEYLYIYKPHDEDCEKLESKIIDFAKKEDVVFMNGDKNVGNAFEFDWESFHQENDIEIGIVNENKEIIYNEGESAEKYLNSSEETDYGEIIKYQIVIGDNEYLKMNNKAKKNYVYAMRLTPDIDYHGGNYASKYIVLDFPALYYQGDDESIKDCYFGVEEIEEFLKNYK